ncbi:type IV secretion system DNA-binding domain-containing protein [Arenimonas sp. MALMAid1274]|uniref:type IV secretion system DNA-binding domain-containing protein n=1 Tax=Arenimonas sp. MALMAid1274 TaxID=3411630 RepID=UPI003B9E841F
MAKVYDAFGPVPAHVAPSTLVRRWDQALLAAGATVLLLWALGLAIGLAFPGPWLGPYFHHFIAAPQTMLHYATVGMSFKAQARAYLVSISPMEASAALRVGLPLLLAVLAGAWVFRRGLVPSSNTWHLSGPRLLEGKEALVEARLRSLTPEQQKADPLHLAVHPALVWPKKHWSRHGFLYGSVGSGKTQVLLPIVEQIIARNQKLFLYDVKGDFTAAFRRPIIVSPFDRRSYVWDIGKDVRTPTQAAAFAASLIPEDTGNGRFWSQAAQQLLTGAIRFLQNTKGTEWGWKDLADAVARGAPEMLVLIQEHYAKAAPLIANAESQSTASVLATLAGYTRVIDDLALAWPRRSKRSFSITDWIQDDYHGPSQIIVQAGEAQLTRAYIAAMVNIAVPSIISPALSENEEGRGIHFILDELPSLGVINLAPLIDRGRSKGVVVLAACQDTGQLKAVYGEHQAKSLLSMVGTHIVCQVQAGETREEVARLLGKNKVAWRNHGDGAHVHEESRGVVSSSDLTDKLGFRKGKAMGPLGWGIRAIVFTSGDPLLLDFPGVELPKKREAQVAAEWTLKPAGAQAPAPVAKPPAPERPVGLSQEELQREMERIYGAD